MNTRIRAALVALTMTAAALSWTATTAQACTVPDWANHKAVTVPGPCSGKSIPSHSGPKYDGDYNVYGPTGKNADGSTKYGWTSHKGARTDHAGRNGNVAAGGDR